MILYTLHIHGLTNPACSSECEYSCETLSCSTKHRPNRMFLDNLHRNMGHIRLNCFKTVNIVTTDVDAQYRAIRVSQRTSNREFSVQTFFIKAGMCLSYTYKLINYSEHKICCAESLIDFQYFSNGMPHPLATPFVTELK